MDLNEKRKTADNNILPLLSLEKLKAKETHKISLINNENQKKWKEFIDRLPESQNETVPRELDKYWRWKNYKKYIPEERTNFRKTMSIGPKIDQFGRLPIPEDLNKFRTCTDHKLNKIGAYLRKGDGLRKIEQLNKEKEKLSKEKLNKEKDKFRKSKKSPINITNNSLYLQKKNK